MNAWMRFNISCYLQRKSTRMRLFGLRATSWNDYAFSRTGNKMIDTACWSQRIAVSRGSISELRYVFHPFNQEPIWNSDFQHGGYFA